MVCSIIMNRKVSRRNPKGNRRGGVMNITAVGVVATALIASPILLSATIAFRPPVCPQTRRSPMSSAVMLFATIESQQEQQAAPNQFDDQDMDISETISEENKQQQQELRTTTEEAQKKKKQRLFAKNNNNFRHNNNKAMADPVFLQKRTETLLRMTSPENDIIDSISLGNVGGGNMKVDKRTFDWLIDAWAYSGADHAVEYTLRLLKRMEHFKDRMTMGGDDGDEYELYPDVKTYTKVINAIANSGKEDAGEQAEAILNRMIDMNEPLTMPNTYTYTNVIDAYARSAPYNSNAPYSAQRLAERMEELRATSTSEQVKPTARAWNSVIGAWADWMGEEMPWGEYVGSGAERAESCLDIMDELASVTGNEDVRPNSYNFNSVISAWANNGGGDAAFRAENILERMEVLYRQTGQEDVKPRTVTYNAVIDAWAKSGELDGAHRAELLLGHMMELFETGHNVDAKPNVRSFNTVLNAWAKSGVFDAPVRALKVLSRMEELASSDWDDVLPDATSFATVINAYARSNTFGKADSAYEVYTYMKEMYDATGNIKLRPNNIIYNSVLNACAFTMGDFEEQSRAIEIANSMLMGLDESPYGKPDHITYGTYLKVIANQMDPSPARTEIAANVFQKCARDGMVGGMVLRQLREMGMADEEFEELVGVSIWKAPSLSDLPSSWTCNVIEGKRLRRRQFR
mmetsp:Transcript_26115/g.40623  ORF Transcript_26115/g.40623 Transcript_26115/m.40623 type:complete len:690 (+) Transcript_26115:247-2316(+)